MIFSRIIFLLSNKPGFDDLRVAFLRWWGVFLLSLAGCWIIYSLDLFSVIWDADITKLSYATISLYFIASYSLGIINKNMMFHVAANDGNPTEYIKGKLQVIAYFSNTMLGLGFLGTLIGFMIMAQAFVHLDTSNAASVQHALSQMASGIHTAIITTVVGLICSMLLNLQLMSFEYGLRKV